MTKVKVTYTIDQEIVERINNERGLVPESTWANRILKEHYTSLDCKNEVAQ